MNHKQKIVSLMDYTSLSGKETEGQILKLAKDAHSPLGPVASVCVYPRYVSLLKDAFVQAKLPVLPVASVVNFPNGTSPVDEVIAEIHYALQQGADEIDMVISNLGSGVFSNLEEKREFIRACRNETHGIVLKLIIESGKLSPEDIKDYSHVGITAGVDFLKTSTGKTPVGATLEAAEIMLNCIKNSGARCGFKASGGIRCEDDATAYMELAERILGKDFVCSTRFRLGASGLLQALTAQPAAKKVQDEY